MDGRRRLVEPVTDGAPTRPAAGTAPETWRVRAQLRIPLDLKFVGDIKLVRALRRRWPASAIEAMRKPAKLATESRKSRSSATTSGRCPPRTVP